MTWEDKTKMIILLNNEEYGNAADVVIENLSVMDEQGLDMFITGMQLTEDCISKDIDKHIKITNGTKEFKFNSIRTAMRISLYEEIVSKLK